ncbi:condensation domain-containing protein [Actinophytocola sp.]|uniref:condensation domain-containing protein n=1 Tax=Actinophytocola sp. TaxID=1872138 RepID=UPI003D6BF38F
MPGEEGLPAGRVVERVPVPFEGEGSGEAELTWGQIGLWQSIELSGMSKTVFYTEERPPGTTVEHIADELRFMVSRHQALRTRLVLRENGPPRQRCATSGEVTLEVVDTEGADPADIAEATSQRYQSVPFEYGSEWPVRLAAIRHEDVITHTVLVVLHTSIDAYGLSALARDIAARDPETGEAAGPVTASQPLEQAAKQASPAGRRQNATSLKYLDRVLRTMTPSRFGEPRYGGERTIDMIHLRSPATLLAVRTVAAREKIDDSPVLLASFAVGLARFTGVNPVVAMLMVGNRFRPGLADSVSALIQISPYLIDVAGITMGQAVERAAGSAINAYKNAYYNPYEQDEVIERVEADRGEELDLSCFYNDRRQQERGHAGEELDTPQRIRDALADTEISWEPEISMPQRNVYFNVDDPPGAIEFVMSVDTRYFARPDMEAIMRNVEEAAVQAAVDPAAPTRISRPVTAGAVQ